MAKKIAILFGGRSVEHEISIRSATNIADQLPDHFEQILIGITKKGDWYLCREVSDQIESGEPLTLSLSVSKPFFLKTGSSQLITADIIFPVLHGTDGEDGSIQGLFKSLDLPLVGSGVTGSAVCMDKVLTKKLLAQSGIPVVPFLTISKGDVLWDYPTIVEKLGAPFMVKSSNLGSSVGVSKVSTEKEYNLALEDSFQYSDEIIIESYVKGKEIECAVMGNNKPESTWPGEIALDASYGFYSYQAKYQDEKAIKMIIPAGLTKEKQDEVRMLSEKAYRILKCDDYARVDVFVADSGQVFINEINTIPGFTSASMFPVLWQNMGLSYPDLLERLIELAQERWVTARKLERNYEGA